MVIPSERPRASLFARRHGRFLENEGVRRFRFALFPEEARAVFKGAPFVLTTHRYREETHFDAQ